MGGVLVTVVWRYLEQRGVMSEGRGALAAQRSLLFSFGGRVELVTHRSLCDVDPFVGVVTVVSGLLCGGHGCFVA